MTPVRYLSLDWIDALNAQVARCAALSAATAGHELGMTQVVTDTPEGDITYHFAVVAGRGSFGAGPADHEDVRMVQDWDTAVGVATGTLNAQEAFIKGRIRLSGNQEKLMSCLDIFTALNEVFDAVSPETTYA
jgi:hypothetical protein